MDSTSNANHIGLLDPISIWYLAAVSMQILFFITALWVGTSGTEFYQDNTTEVNHAMRIQLGLGWLMCILAGIGFSILATDLRRNRIRKNTNESLCWHECLDR